MNTTSHDLAGSDPEANAQQLFARLSSGRPPNGIEPKDCGVYADRLEALVEALSDGGPEAVEQAAEALRRADDGFDRLAREAFGGGEDERRGGGGGAPSIISAEDLMQQTFPPPRWAVPGLISEGLTMLAGKPKIGKSFLCLNLGLAVARGGRALGKIGVEQGEALYLALEDSPRRLQERLQTMLSGSAAPGRFHLATDWPRMDGEEGGLRHLSGWIDEHPETRLVIIDTFGKARQAPNAQANVYYDEYGAGGLMKTVADRHGVAVLVIHHTNKLKSAEDPFDMISGSTGLTGVVDTAAVMKRDRTEADAVLHAAGRDVDAFEWALRFEPHVCSWTVKGDAEDYRRSKERRAIIEVLREAAPEALGPKEIADATEQPYSNVTNLLSKMAGTGAVRKPERGKYTLSPAPGENGENDENPA